MKTDPTSSIASSNGPALSYGTIQSKRHQLSPDSVKPRPGSAISDTLETSDREPGPRLKSDSKSIPEADSPNLAAPRDRLDFIG